MLTPVRSIKCALLMLLLLVAVPIAANDGSAAPVRIAVLGDSLSAGYGLTEEEAFPTLLQVALRQEGYHVDVEGAGVSGDTSAGGRARLEWLLAGRPDVVIIELGGNDALRGIDPEETRSNIDAILARLRDAGVKVLLTGMRAPRNMGQDYYSRFDRLYPELAERHQVPLYPFFLEGVAGQRHLNLADGIHPNADGIQVIVDNLLPQLTELLDSTTRPNLP